MPFCDPDKDCAKCPRLVDYRTANRKKFATYHNAPVASFGSLNAQILIVGLAPGLNGANQTNRPFTNDYAGDILYPALKKFSFATGIYQKRSDDGFQLLNVRISNTVRCVPPKNAVTSEEIKNCRPFLQAEIKSMPNLRVILALGRVAHNGILGALGVKQSSFLFCHGKMHTLGNGIILLDSYHTSRYNINTKTLTNEMFEQIIATLRALV